MGYEYKVVEVQIWNGSRIDTNAEEVSASIRMKVGGLLTQFSETGIRVGSSLRDLNEPNP